MAEFTWDTVVDFLNQNNVPEIALAIMGILAIAIVFAYRSNDEGTLYRVLVLLGLIFAIFMIYIAVAINTGWEVGTLIVVTLACFTLVIRPFRDLNFSLILSIVLAVWVYIFLGGLTGDLAILATGWPRIIVAVVAGSLVYMLTRFIQDVAQLFGKLLNAWPLLFVLGVLCIAEAAMLYMGYNSIIDYIRTLLESTSAII